MQHINGSIFEAGDQGPRLAIATATVVQPPVLAPAGPAPTYTANAIVNGQAAPVIDRPRPGTPPPPRRVPRRIMEIRDAWAAASSGLAVWADQRLVNRRDVHGSYFRGGDPDRNSSFTAKTPL